MHDTICMFSIFPSTCLFLSSMSFPNCLFSALFSPFSFCVSSLLLVYPPSSLVYMLTMSYDISSLLLVHPSAVLIYLLLCLTSTACLSLSVLIYPRYRLSIPLRYCSTSFGTCLSAAGFYCRHSSALSGDLVFRQFKVNRRCRCQRPVPKTGAENRCRKPVPMPMPMLMSWGKNSSGTEEPFCVKLIAPFSDKNNNNRKWSKDELAHTPFACSHPFLVPHHRGRASHASLLSSYLELD